MTLHRTFTRENAKCYAETWQHYYTGVRVEYQPDDRRPWAIIASGLRTW